MSAKTALAATLALVPLLGACSAGDNLASLTALTIREPAAPPLAEAVTPGAALAALPREAGAVVSVVETRRSDGVDQKITLVGDVGSRGDNEIAVASRKHARGRVAPQVDEATIQAEMAERLPGIAMTVTPRVVIAPAGPIGVATGRTASGSGCLYAWSAGNPERPRAVTTARLLGIDGPESNDLQVRVRLCRQGASEETLIAIAEGLQVRSATTGSTLRADTARGYAGADALATAGYGGATIPTAAPAPVVYAEASAPVFAAPAPVVAARPTPARLAPTTPAPVVARAPAKPAVTVAAAKPMAPVAASNVAAPVAPAAPAIVAAPIPLPSGG